MQTDTHPIGISVLVFGVCMYVHASSSRIRVVTLCNDVVEAHTCNELIVSGRVAAMCLTGLVL